MVNLDEAVQEFLIESRENLDQLDRDFVALETRPGDRERTAAIFRTVHTIKGTAGFLGFGKLESLTHAGESLLSQVREGTLALDAEITSALLAMVDRVRAMLALVESTGKDGDVSHDDLIVRLNDLRSVRGASTTKPPMAAEPAVPAPPPAATAKGKGAKGSPAAAPAPSPAAAPAPASPAPASAPASPAPASPADAPAPAAAAAAPAPAKVAAAPAAAPPAAPEHSVSDLNVRVDVGLLDKLMNLVGELVLARNQLVQIGARIEDQAFASAAQRLSLITTELQENVMKTRMQPIGTVWSKLPRVVRDLAVQLGKQVRLEMVGQETELDRTILESIKDALTHIVRNSVDHGIEMPDKRAAAGKAKTGTLTLRAFHEGGQVNVEIADDGGGVNVDAVRRKAVERGLISAERAARMGDFELTQLIFLPGFSTAEKVSNISGRGVGMDVVKTNIERIGGTVDVVSRPGQGTTLRIKIPLTLAIIPALLTASGGQRYAIPQVNLVELVRIDADAEQGVERVQGSAFFRLRGELLPLIFLSDQLRGSSRNQSGLPSSTVRFAGLDIELERARYRALTPLLARHVAEHAPLPPEEPLTSSSSSLGMWLRAHAEASPALADAHAAFFVGVQAVLHARASGDVVAAFRALGDLTPLVQTLDAALAALASRVTETAGTNIVVLQADDHQFGLVVDEVLDTEEIVVKPLGKELKGIAVFAGATIMGDGRVALILDVAGLAQHAEAVDVDRASDELDDVDLDVDGQGRIGIHDDKQTLLMFSVGDDEVMAIPLSAVARIEEFPYEKIERVGRRPVVQYRGAILPLVELGPVLGPLGAPQDPRRPVHVIVYASGGRNVGLIVNKILDVVTEAIEIDRSSARSSVIGAAVVQGRVIEILDAEDVLRTQAPTLLPRSAL